MQTKKLDMQSKVIRVLTTPLGSRIMRPLFGSKLFELIDRNYDTGYRLDAVAYTAEAIERNLPELQIREIRSKDGEIDLRLFDGKQEEEVRVVFAA